MGQAATLAAPHPSPPDAPVPPAETPIVRRLVWGAWAVVRFVGVVLLTGRWFYPQVDRDIFHYASWAQLLYGGQLPWRDFRVEYPPGVAPFMALPGGNSVFELEFLVLALAADAAILVLLRRQRARGPGVWMWLAAPILIGPVLWVRFDVFVALALVGFLAAMRAERWRLAGVCLAAATLLKLWPIALLVVLWRVVPAGSRRRLVGWTVAVIAAATLPVVAYGGGSGLWWMVGYQGNRGLEMETVFAWPVVVAHSLGASLAVVPGHGTVEVPISSAVSPIFLALLVGSVLAVAAWVWRDAGSRITVDAACLALVAVVFISSKMLSAQYVVWAVAVTAVVLNSRQLPPGRRGWVAQWRLLAATALLAVTTQALYPFNFANAFYGTFWGVVATTAHAEAVVLWVAVVLVSAPRLPAHQGRRAQPDSLATTAEEPSRRG